MKNFLKILFENKKSPPDSSNREEKVIEELLNCKVSFRNKITANQLPKFKSLLILGNETASKCCFCIEVASSVFMDTFHKYLVRIALRPNYYIDFLLI